MIKKGRKKVGEVSHPFMDSVVQVYNEFYLEEVFLTQMANLNRFNSHFTVLFLSINIEEKDELNQNNKVTCKRLGEYLSKQTRDTDKVFFLKSQNVFVVLLANSGEVETTAFIQRALTQEVVNSQLEERINLNGVIVPIYNKNTTYQEVYEKSIGSLQEIVHEQSFVFPSISEFSNPSIEQIKASIIVEDETLENIFINMLHRVTLDSCEMDLQTFEDGEAFLNSTWHASSHVHVVLLEDTLMKRNGMEMVYELRKFPNGKKFIILMFSNKYTEEEAAYAMDQGVDIFIPKPFNLRFIEARLRRYVKRMK